jgi:hypothetical protein
MANQSPIFEKRANVCRYSLIIYTQAPQESRAEWNYRIQI